MLQVFGLNQRSFFKKKKVHELQFVNKLLNRTKATSPIHKNANLFFDKKKKGTSAKLWPSLQFYGMIKSQHLYKVMA